MPPPPVLIFLGVALIIAITAGSLRYRNSCHGRGDSRLHRFITLPVHCIHAEDRKARVRHGSKAKKKGAWEEDQHFNVYVCCHCGMENP